MSIQNTERQEEATHDSVTDTQGMWLYKTTNIHEDTDCGIKHERGKEPEKNLFIV